MALFALALLFAGLFAGVAVLAGIGTPALPRGTVAVIEGAPEELATVSAAEFERALKYRAEEAQLKRPPRPGEEKYEELSNAAVGRLLTAVWLQSEAVDMGVQPSHRQLTQSVRTNPETESLRERGATEEEVLESGKRQWLVEAIETALERPVVEAYGGKVPRAALERKKTEVFLGFDAHMRSKWQLRTRCAEDFVMDQCGNVAPFVHSSAFSNACYEADPEVPPEACPAPVFQPHPALPGSVTPFWPQGERLPQGPLFVRAE